MRPKQAIESPIQSTLGHTMESAIAEIDGTSARASRTRDGGGRGVAQSAGGRQRNRVLLRFARNDG